MVQRLRALFGVTSRYALIVACCCVTVHGPALAAEELSEVVLENGMRVVLRPVHTNPVICSAVLVRAGVAWEPEALSGASHFLEHLLFNGTVKRTQEQLYGDVDRIGAYNNATTRADHTLFLLLAPEEHLGTALEIQADMLLHSTLPQEKFEKEKGIVLEEMGRDSGNPTYLADQFFENRLYAGSPYARPVLGTVDSIRGLTRDAVLEYYRERYVPERMVLLLTGDFEPEKALALVREHFGAAGHDGKPVEPDTSMPRASIAFEPQPQIAHQRIEAGRTYLRAAFPAPAERDVDATAFGLFVEAIGGGGSSAVEGALKGGDEPAVFDYSLYHDTTGGSGALIFTASLTGAATPGDVVRLAANAMIDSVREKSIDPENLRLLRESKLTEDVTLAEQVHYYAMLRSPRFLQASVQEVLEEAARGQTVGAEAFDRLLGRYLDPLRAVVTLSGPEEPDGAMTPLDLSEVGKAPSLPARSAEVVVLDNGLTLSVHTEPGAAVFGAHLIARNRSDLEPSERPGLADLVHHLLLRGSLARDAGGIDDELRGRGVNIKLYDNPNFPFDDYRTVPAYSFIMLETRAERAVEALRLLAEIIQTPRFDEVEIRNASAELQDIARRKTESSSAVSRRLFHTLLAADHPLSRPVAGTVDSLDGVTRTEVLEMWSRLFAPQNLILTIRGSGNKDAVVRRASEIFGGAGPGGGWSEGASTATAKLAPTKLVAPPSVTEASKRGEDALNKRQSYLRMGAVIETDLDDSAALAALNLVLSDRLQMDLREQQGLAYSIGSGLSPLGAGRQLLSVSMGTAPDNLEKAEGEIRRVAAALGDEKVPQDELDRIVAARKGRILMRRLPRQNQAYYDGLTLLYGRPSGGELESLEALSSVTPDEILAVAKRYLDLDDWAVAIVR
jgi:zinc protease